MKNIHKFKQNNKNIILDINSGSVHLVDELIWDMIDLYNENDLKEINNILSYKYDKELIKEGYAEIEELEKNDVLFSDDIYMESIKYDQEKVVKALCLHIAHDCNLKCEYCFASQGDFDGDKSLMSLEVGKKALDCLVKNSANRRNLEVDFFGGEPLMNFDVVKELVYYGRSLEKKYDKNFRFTITTNGVLLDKEKMNFINEHMSNVVLSLDGRKDVNDNMRKTVNGEGSFDIIVPKFLDMVRLRGNKDHYVRGTFTSKNLDFSKDIMELYNLGFKSVSVEPVVIEPSQEYAILEKHLGKILDEYDKLSKDYIDIKRKDNDFNFFHFTIDLNQGPCAIKRASGCGAGVEYLAITPEGYIYPCHQFVGNEKFKLGSLDTGIRNNEIVDKFKEANVYNKEDCKDCWARFYCSGGCHANAYNFNKDIKKPYKIGCEMEKKRIESSISILANLNEEEV
ncbi:thioether cross-link-forming SCIFF peptide maturase [Clostridium sp. D2Q-14]|uniref:thioether cross-link-forming SCIFF peptide maturase n=1 Tax=Anaeromonas gelatinilytica TaxID=2683194 RepID=UPI00193C5987|nr:thioether cross-link-forming SCIFF peptide maturase [Anaeromonas gelatinilytica]MBS4534239.1 thioether cross-link-forming SCIFF peptide maturase [Anaeromonas gelatinilytica]